MFFNRQNEIVLSHNHSDKPIFDLLVNNTDLTDTQKKEYANNSGYKAYLYFKANINPEDYDVVYLGTPVWAGKASTPLYSYIKQNADKFKNVKFFVTAGGKGFDSTLEQMERITQKPQSTLTLTTKEVKKNEYTLEGFVD